MFELTSFSASESVAIGAEDADAPISSSKPRLSLQLPDLIGLAAGTGADAANLLSYIQGDATTTPEVFQIGSSGIGIASRATHGGDPYVLNIGAEPVKFTKIRYMIFFNFDTTNKLLVWGGTDAPTELASAITILPSTSANPGKGSLGAPGSAGYAIAATSKLNISSSAGTVPFGILLVGE